MPLLRSEVTDSKKWDLSGFFVSQKDFDKLFDDVKSLIPALKAYEDIMNEENAHEVLDLNSTISRGVEKMYIYAYVKRDEDTSDANNQALMQKMKMLSVEVSLASSFILPKLASFSKATLKKLNEKPEYKNYTTIIRDIIREKKYILGKKEEKILSEVGSFSGDFSNIFTMIDNADLKFGTVKDENGNDVELSHGTYAVLLQNPNQEIRKNAFEAYYKAYASLHNTIAATYTASVKKDCSLSKIRGYSSALDGALYSEGISKTVYDNLIKSVKAATPLIHRYIGIRKEALRLKELHMYDLYVPITKEAKLEMEYEDAYELVIEALKPLGEDYGALLRRARDERWIDVEETKNKRSGAYSISCYDTDPLVLLNYKKTTHDVFTIAHEMGHAIHSYLSNSNQCYEKAGYTIFLAEIASTVNEMLLLKHLLNNNPTNEMKVFLLSYFIDMLRTTIFRQTMFSEFEKFAHAEIEASNPLTAEIMDKKYLELNKEYYGNKVIHDEPIAHEWSRIPHFYRSFYVYKYATGLTAAINIVNKILSEENYVEKYLNFLSLGGSKMPLDALKTADVDLEKQKAFKVVSDEFKLALRKLGKSI